MQEAGRSSIREVEALQSDLVCQTRGHEEAVARASVAASLGDDLQQQVDSLRQGQDDSDGQMAALTASLQESTVATAAAEQVQSGAYE